MARDPLIGNVLADRFQILDRIGEGGMGVVYKARQMSVDRVVAIKVLGAHLASTGDWVQRFHNEARAASLLQHPNTIRLIDFGQTREGMFFIAMEFLQGRNLRTELNRVGRLAPPRVLKILSQICQSLSEAHRNHIIHRDLKPDNIFLVEMLGAEEYVKVLDFGVAKLVDSGQQMTRAGMVFGTPKYMSPEQGRALQLDPRADVYSLGVLAFEMLMGKCPFDAENPLAIIQMHVKSPAPPLPGVPPATARMVLRALSKEPAGRQQSVDELYQECQAALPEAMQCQAAAAVSQATVKDDPMAAATAALAGQGGLMGAPGMPMPPRMMPPLVQPPTMAVPGMPPSAMPPPVAMPIPPRPQVQQPVVPTAAIAPHAAAGAGAQGRTVAIDAPVPVRPPSAPALPVAAQPPTAPAAAKAPLGAKTMAIGSPPATPPPATPPPFGRTSAAQASGVSVPSMPASTGPATVAISDSEGVVSFALARKREEEMRRRRGHILFFSAWVALGVTAGLLVHFLVLHGVPLSFLRN